MRVPRRAEVFAEAARLLRRRRALRHRRRRPAGLCRNRDGDAGAALRGYRKLARLAAALVAPHRGLFLASCSFHIGEAEFTEAVRVGLADAGGGGRAYPAPRRRRPRPPDPSVAARDRLSQDDDIGTRLNSDGALGRRRQGQAKHRCRRRCSTPARARRHGPAIGAFRGTEELSLGLTTLSLLATRGA